MIAEFHHTLSDRTVYLRYFSSLSLGARIAHDRLVRICFGDYDREITLVAERRDSQPGTARILGVCRLYKLRTRNEAEVAVVVSDASQNLGLGYQLLSRVIEVARDEKLSRLSSEMTPDHAAMQILSQRLGFQLHRIAGGKLTAVLEL
jgi:acetyltransferase